MKNYVKPGEVMSLTAPYAVTSGAGLLVGSIFGVATMDAANGAAVEAQVVGVFDINKLGTDVVAQGAPLYWDDTNKRLTVTSTSNTLVGVAEAAAGNGVTEVRTRLNGSFS